MATFLINCSNLKAGGGLQVADSICRELNKYPQHHFIIVLGTPFEHTLEAIKDVSNIEVFKYDIHNNFRTIILGRDYYLDNLLLEKRVDAVLTVFGPSRWRPRCEHICGFARAQLLLKNPARKKSSLKERMTYAIWKWGFKKSAKVFYTENSSISRMLPELLGDIKVYTVTNYYNQVFDSPQQWKTKLLSPFSGTTILTVSSSYPHKNLEIATAVTRSLIRMHPDFSFRFVFSINREQYHADINGIEGYFEFLGEVTIEECPSLYQQCDIAFQPSLLECFTATYPEAMRMEIPIVTTDLDFAKGLCGDAACYYNAIDPDAAAEAIYKVATDKQYANQLVENGKRMLLTYDNYKQRAEKLIGILEEISNKR